MRPEIPVQFKKRKHNTPNLEMLNIDSEPAIRLRRAIRKKDFGVAEQTLQQARDTNLRTHLLEAAADWTSTTPALSAWFASGSDLSLLVGAIHRSKMAWNYSNWTHGASDPQQFQSEVRACVDWFDQYAQSTPEDTSVYYWRIWLARAQFNGERARALGDEAVERDPGNIFNAANTLATESTHWFGDASRAIDHAKQLSQRVSRDVGASTLPIQAHYLHSFESPNYWASPATKSDIIQAHTQNPITSVQSITAFRAAHWLAWGLSKIERHDLARPYFEMLTGDAPAEPWGSLRFGLDVVFSAYRTSKKKALR